jgi:hypothetical protein
MSLFAPLPAEKRRKVIYGASAVAICVFVGLGVFAKNGWLPSTDPLTGKKTGWFGKDLPKNAGSTWNPLAAPLPTATPQLSKEYVYAGQRLLAVEDANANAAPPGDIAVWRPSTGVWYVLGGPGSQQTIAAWGHTSPPDIPVPGDYDGDGKTDFATIQPAASPGSSTWWVLRSSDGNYNATGWGNDQDVKAPADYDGDGKTDIAVYRPSTGYWYILRSSDGQTLIAQWGTNGDIPAPADYDGDGKADIAVWRPNNTTFYAIRSSDGQLQQATFGSSGATPVSADYDGDGKADFALLSGNVWTILQSSNNTPTSITWQNAGDIPVQNDYDGDGKVDIAVWRPTDSPSGTLGNWYIRNSHDNSTRIEQWGTTNDIPVPAFYRR